MSNAENDRIAEQRKEASEERETINLTLFIGPKERQMSFDLLGLAADILIGLDEGEPVDKDEIGKWVDSYDYLNLTLLKKSQEWLDRQKTKL